MVIQKDILDICESEMLFIWVLVVLMILWIYWAELRSLVGF